MNDTLLLLLFRASVASVAFFWTRSAFAATETVGDITWTYTISDGTASIGGGWKSTAVPTTTAGAVSIPDNLGRCPVTRIDDYAFDSCSAISSISIPDSVTNVGHSAFYGCSGLTKVHVSDLTTWCKISFRSDTSNPLYYAGHLFVDGQEIKQLEIPSGVTAIKDYAFSGWSGLTSISIPNGVTSIGNGAFLRCSGISSIVVPETVTNIGWSAFSECSNLSSITIPDSVESIGGGAFSGCDELAEPIFSSTALWYVPQTTTGSFVVPEGVTTIGSQAFSGCSQLNTIVLPDSVTTIGNGAFQSCSGLSSFTIPQNVMIIGDYMFAYCSALESVSIPDSVTSIGDCAFYNCSRLSSITIPDGVKSIGMLAFDACSGLTSITIPHSVTNLEPYVLNACQNLSNVVFDCNPAGSVCMHRSELNDDGTVSTIKEYRGILYGCPGPIRVELTTNVTSIGVGVFGGCSGISSITIPGSVINIGKCAFFGIDDSSVLVFAEDSPWMVTSEGVLCSKDETILVEALNLLEREWTIPDSVKKINAGCFSGHAELVSLQLPSGLTEIGESAFEGCLNLSSLELPSGLTNIGESAFEGCLHLSSLELPNGLKQIHDGTFSGCSKLTLLSIPENVTSIGRDAFSGCNGMHEIMLPEGLAVIGQNAFRECSSLETVSIPGSVLTLADDLFCDCANMEELVLPRHFQPIVGRFGIPESTTIRYADVSTLTSPIPVSYAWLERFPGLLAEHGDDYEIAANGEAANGKNRVWECYLAGIDPTDASAAFTCSIGMNRGKPSFSWNPDLGEARSYNVVGKNNLADFEWKPGPVANQRFFQVKVQPPTITYYGEF